MILAEEGLWVDSRPPLVDQHRAVRTAHEFFRTVTVAGSNLLSLDPGWPTRAGCWHSADKYSREEEISLIAETSVPLRASCGLNRKREERYQE